MSDADQFRPCDVCGRPARNLARDRVRCNDVYGILHSAPEGDIKAGCDEHQPESYLREVSAPEFRRITGHFPGQQ